MRSTYKGITFAEGYDRSFADFKEELGKTHIFMAIPENKRNAELKKVHARVLKETKNWAKKKKPDTSGNSKTTANKS